MNFFKYINVNINVQCTKFHNLETLNDLRQTDMKLKQSIVPFA